MRAQEFITEGTLSVDVPNEDWLQDKIDYAKSKGRNSYGVPYMGSTTAYVQGTPPRARVMRLASLPGMRNEQTNIRKNDLKWLMDYMEKTGKLPPMSSSPDHEYLPYIAVAYNGEAWVNEGNHRIMAAYRLNWQDMPIEIRYFDGGERIKDGPMYPGKIGLGNTPKVKEQDVAEGAGANIETIIQSFVASPTGQKYKQHDCKTVTRAFVQWAEQNKIPTQVVSLAPPSANFIAKNPRYKGKSGEGDGHIMPIVNGNAIDFTVRQFGVNRPFNNPLVTPTNSLPAIYGKFGYFTDKPEWFLGGKSHWIGALNSIPKEIFNQNFGDEILEHTIAETQLTELMDYKSAYKLEFDKGFDNSLYATAYDADGRVIDITITQGHGRKDSAEIEFSRGGSLELTGKGDAEKVFATVLTAIDYYLEVVAQPKYLAFQAKEPSRIRFYDALVKRFASKYGYERVDLSKTSAATQPGAYILRKAKP